VAVFDPDRAAGLVEELRVQGHVVTRTTVIDLYTIKTVVDDELNVLRVVHRVLVRAVAALHADAVVQIDSNLDAKGVAVICQRFHRTRAAEPMRIDHWHVRHGIMPRAATAAAIRNGARR
jgi:hypothetical protein